MFCSNLPITQKSSAWIALRRRGSVLPRATRRRRRILHRRILYVTGRQNVLFQSSCHTKTLRVDRTAAERKRVAKSNPPQAENPAPQDSLCDRKAECFVPIFLSHKNAPRGSHCGERKHVAKSNPLQAENPAEQDSMPYTKNRKFCSGFSVIYPDIINKKRREKT